MLITVLNFETGAVDTHDFYQYDGQSAEDVLLRKYDSLDNLQWMAHDEDPDEFIERWHTDDAKVTCEWLTDDQAREVMEGYLDRCKSDDFEVIAIIADMMFPEPEEAA
jgi:hypothetical protein